jgi:hypothetical protein
MTERSLTPQIHDYRKPQRRLGHDYILTPDQDPATAWISGWGGGIRLRDLLLLTHPEYDGHVIYQVTEIRYHSNPADMWRGRVRFIPGSSDLGLAVEAAVTLAEPGGQLHLAFIWPRRAGRSRVLEFARQLTGRAR